MKKVVTNTGNSPMYMMGQMVPPGEMVVVDVPDEAQAVVDTVPAPTLAEQVAELMGLSVPKLSAELSSLHADALDMLQALEEAAPKPRQTLLVALADERIKRANDKLVSDKL